MERHRILGDQVILYQRSEGGSWHCSTFLKGKEWRKSTKEKSLARAKDVATDWFNGLQAKNHLGELNTGKTFAQTFLNSVTLRSLPMNGAAIKF
jgi:hypothetical protein